MIQMRMSPSSMSLGWEQGFSSKEDNRGPRDSTRARYKIFPEENQDALLMQIVPDGKKPDVRPRYLKEIKKGIYDFVDSKYRFIVIGDRQENIYINEDGILYFAINDIVLDDATIVEMMLNIIKKKYDVIFEDETKTVVPKLNSLREEKVFKSTDDFLNDTNSYYDFLRKFGINDPKTFQPDSTKNGKMSFGDFAFGTTSQTDFIELYGYFMFKYQTPWYDDNLGSFLIVVETSSN